MITKKFAGTIVSIFLALLVSPAFATIYPIPTDGNLVGDMDYIKAAGGETLVTIAQRFDLGLNAMMDANPGIPGTAPIPTGMHISIPSVYLLPNVPRQGIVINLPEMRMYYYTGDGSVRTYPIGIGRVGKTIPLKRTDVVRKVKNPVWIPPEDIRAFDAEQGITLPKIMPSGPDNPLGPLAIYLGIPTYLIHSTIFPESIGRRASFGCIRMHESDIKDFFPLVMPGTEVTIVDMPTKVGWHGDDLFLEVHPPLEEHSEEYAASPEAIINAINGMVANHPSFIDWQLVADLSQSRDGIPHVIGHRIHS
jgi:L,D-transpeptidase ErfK/SrfK